MLPALRDSERRRLLETGLILCGLAFALMPLANTSSIASAAQTQPVGASQEPFALPEAFRFPQLEATRDPFVPGRAILTSSSETRSSAALVHAVVLGTNPRALVEAGGTVKILAIGDSIEDATIASIDANGVTLSNGTRLVLEESERP